MCVGGTSPIPSGQVSASQKPPSQLALIGTLAGSLPKENKDLDGTEIKLCCHHKGDPPVRSGRPLGRTVWGSLRFPGSHFAAETRNVGWCWQRDTFPRRSNITLLAEFQKTKKNPKPNHHPNSKPKQQTRKSPLNLDSFRPIQTCCFMQIVTTLLCWGLSIFDTFLCMDLFAFFGFFGRACKFCDFSKCRVQNTLASGGGGGMSYSSASFMRIFS